MQINPRLVPVLLTRGTGVVKTVRFGRSRYLGDAVNTAAIFNDKRVDEITVLDIDAPRERRGPNVALLRDLASQCFMPLTFGGGITNIDQIEEVLAAGAEKVMITTSFYEQPQLVTRAAERFGSQSIVVGLDVRRASNGHAEVYVSAGRKRIAENPVVAARRAVDTGAGEIVIQAIDRDGTWSGYDLPLVRSVAAAVDVSVVALGGARHVDDMADVVVNGGASAAAAGSVFVFFGRLNAVLVNVPDESTRAEAFIAASTRPVVP